MFSRLRSCSSATARWRFLGTLAWVALAGSQVAPAQGETVRLQICELAAPVRPGEPPPGKCLHPPSVVEIPASLGPRPDRAGAYTQSAGLLVQATPSTIAHPSQVPPQETRLTSDQAQLRAGDDLQGRVRQLMELQLALARPPARYVRLQSLDFPGLEAFDLASCVDRPYLERRPGDDPLRGCDIREQFFLPPNPVERNSFFACPRPFRGTGGEAADRWCQAETRVAPGLVLRYLVRRSVLADGRWSELERRLREFMGAMVKS